MSFITGILHRTAFLIFAIIIARLIVSLAPPPLNYDPADQVDEDDFFQDKFWDKPEKMLVCSGPYEKGKRPTRSELTRVLALHSKWLSHEKDGERANLCSANLSGMELKGVNLRNANLIKTNFKKATLYDSDLSYANLDNANMEEAGVADVKFIGANLAGANFKKAFAVRANFKKSHLLSASMQDAYVFWADFDEAFFDLSPNSLPNTYAMQSAQNVHKIRYALSQGALLELRHAFLISGMREQERKITYAIKRTERRYLEPLERKISWLALDYTSQYGMAPLRPLRILIWFIFIFSVPYMFAIAGKGHGSIWVVWHPDPSRNNSIPDPSRRLDGTFHIPSPNVPSPLGVVLEALHFSLYSAFNIGWRDLSIGSWLSRLQTKEYVLRPIGWVRLLAGVQSLISVYLLALWLLSYFGRPFDQ